VKGRFSLPFQLIEQNPFFISTFPTIIYKTTFTSNKPQSALSFSANIIEASDTAAAKGVHNTA